MIKKILLFISLCSTILMGGAGETGLAYLKMPVSAKDAGTLSVLSSIGQSPLSLFENPIGIYSNNTQVSAVHNFWFGDVTTDAFALSSRLGETSIGAALNFTRIPDIEVRDAATAEPLYTIDAQYFTGALGASKKILSNLYAGIAVKYLYEKGYVHSAYGGAADFGLLWQAPASLDINISFHNVGKMNEFNNEASELPTTFNLGIIRPDIFVEGPLKATIGLNFGVITKNRTTSASVGGEISYQDMIFLRSGYEQRGSENTQALGIGLKIKKFRFDYSVLFFNDDLSSPNMLTLSYCP